MYATFPKNTGDLKSTPENSTNHTRSSQSQMEVIWLVCVCDVSAGGENRDKE